MSSALSPAANLPSLASGEARPRAGRTPGAARRRLSIAGLGTVAFVGAVALGSQLVSQAWVASQFGW